LRDCTFKPKINKRADDQKDDQEVYDKLYGKYKEQQEKLKKKKEEIEKKKVESEVAECTFKPVKISTDPNANKSTIDKSTIYSERQRKGYEDYIRRARNGTRETFRKKYLKNK
jgi:DNA-binding protein YbaB